MKRKPSKWQAWRHRLKKKVTTPLAWFWYDLRVAVGKWFRKLGSRIAAWWKGRRIRYFFQALPALLVGLVMLVLGTAIVLDSRTDLTSFYQIHASRFVQQRDYSAARVAYERLALFGDAAPEDRFRLAVSLFAAGEKDRAMALVSSLAPLGESNGLAPAHVWLAGQLLSQTSPTRASSDVAERHLLRALQIRPDLTDAHVRLGGLYIQTGRADQAEKHLIAGFDARPEFGLLLSAMYSARGQRQQARNWAERSGRVFAAALESDPSSISARLNLAQAYTLRGEHAQALGLLQEGLSRSGERVYRAAIARTCVAWLDAIPGDGEKEQAQRLALLETGLRFEPNYSDLLLRLVRLARPEGPSADKPREMLQTLLAKGQASVSLHLILGIDAFERGKVEQARQYLDQAYRLDPAGAVLANNLAWVLAHSDPPDLDRALTIINTVVERQPKDPRFRETRGQILARKGNWAEAIADLLVALPSHGDDRDLHKTLAEAYRKTGNAEMAAQHQKLADATANSPPRKP